MRKAIHLLTGSLVLALFGAFSCSDSSSGSDDDDNSGSAGFGPGQGGAGSQQPAEDLVPIADVVEGGLEALRSQACTGEIIETEQLPAILQLIVDVSGSMNAIAPGSNQSKWDVTRAALITSLDDMRQDSAVGVTFYPNMATTVNLGDPVPVESCVDTSDNVSIDLLGPSTSAHRQAIQTAFESAEANDLAGTPTHDAYDIALADLLASSAEGPRYMLLITDGQPTFSEGCVGTGATAYPVDPQPILDAIAAAADQGISTFVIGSPGSEANETTGDDARPWLSEAARLGRTALPGCSDSGPNYCHFDMTQEADFASALTEALLAITSTLQCNYTLTAPPAGMELDIENVNVVYMASAGDDYLVAQNGADVCELGWRLVPETQEIVVCGSTCNTLRADPNGRVELLLGCMSLVPLVE